MMFKKLKTFRPKFSDWIFLLILVIAGAIRFYRITEMAGFDYDQENGSYIVYSILNGNPIRLIGQELSFGGMFMGPFYYYLLVPFYFLSHLHPIGGFVGSAITGLIIITAYYLLGNYLFGRPVGLIAAFLRSILFEELLHDWSMIPSYACEILILATWFCFYKIWNKEKLDFYIPAIAFIFGLYTSMYPILFPFYFVFIVVLALRKIWPKKDIILKSVAAFILAVSPLIIFEFKFGFIQLRRFIEIIRFNSQLNKNGSSLTYFFKYNLSEFTRILGFGFLPKATALILIFLVLGLLIYNKEGFWKGRFHFIVLSVTYLIFILFFTYLPTHVSDNYFLTLSTLALLYIAGTLGIFTKNLLGTLLVFGILLNIAVFNLGLLKARWDNPSLTTLYHKEAIVKEIIRRVPADKEFYVSYISTPGWNWGFKYLFRYYDKIPIEGNAKDPVFTIVIPKELSAESIDISSGSVGLILPNEITQGIHPYEN